MRRRVTLGLALAMLSACTLLTDLDGLTTGAPIEDSGTQSDSTATNEAAVVEVVADASRDAPADAVVEAALDSGPCSDELLVGNRTLDGTAEDVVGAAFIDTYGYSATKAGTAGCVWVYIDQPWNDLVVVGVYADTAEYPTKLLAEATTAKPVQGWNALVLSKPVPIAASTNYWIGMTSLKNGLANRQRHGSLSCGNLHLRVGSSTGTTHPPDPFPAGVTGNDDTCDLLAYLTPAK